MTMDASAAATPAAMDQEAFRLGMRRLAAAVSLVTTELSGGERRGMTATAVCSVSMQPPTLLCCINRRNSTYEAILASRAFAVNVLSVDDRMLADIFAQPVSPQEKFSFGLWRRAITGAPALESAAASFDCRVSHDVTVGTHGILFGEIQGIAVRSGAASPLLYAQGSYGAFTAAGQGSDAGSLWMPTWNYDPS
jgi:flavin reductase